MTILSGSSLILDEYNVDVFIASDTKNHLFDIPYTIYYDGDKVSIFNYKILRYSTNTKVDIKFNDMIIRILIGTEIGVPENYVKAIPDLFICFEKTNYPAKFFYRKAQMWIGAQISKVNVFGHIIYSGTTNRMVFTSENENGILFEGTTHVILESETHKGRTEK
ncbi:MAG TPA: hypothetical protein PKI14_10095 [Fervidobacterium sp.]|nr:hypothetical protein [Fervidobacterium sp.]HOK88213.1 hypothetical protein [Fervidobacterium sp.]HOM74292.1 hypothetical protein [Fervidobacterium sp.]HOQ39825.1 hypothetical protein [Fervidobacterium sp.]HPP17992.1 hypothetical protein [Fervidobacterium sp.]